VPFVRFGAARRRNGFRNKKKRKKREKIGAPTASNSIPVMRERVINRVEIEERRVSALFVLVFCVSRCSLDRKEGEDAKRRETGREA